MISLEGEPHSHKNMAVRDLLMNEQLALLDGLQQFEDVTKYEIQTLRESVDPVRFLRHTDITI